MFSYFETGITDTKCQKIIGLPELRQLIRNNPHAGNIDELRHLRKIGNDSYKDIKSRLPNITPNCIVTERNLDDEHFKTSFRQFSQYIYFDFDDHDNPEEYKRYFIEKFGHFASLVCISSSRGGISALFKVKNQLTRDNFDAVWDKIRDTILSGETVDPSCKGIGRAMFISHDPDVYCNFDNEIEIDTSELIQEQVEKRGNQSKTCSQFNIRLNSPSSIIPINDILAKIRTRTTVEHPSPVVDFMPLEYTEVYFQKNIPDGTKHRTYTSMIHTLVYLNPDVNRQYIFSYLYFINEQHARPKMEKRELSRLFDTVYESIKNTGLTYVNKEIKHVHFNPTCRLSKAEKILISNMLNGARRKNKTIQKIITAKQILESNGQSVTQKRIAELTKLSPKTIRLHRNSNLNDIQELVQMVNDSLPQGQIIKLPIEVAALE